MLTAITTLDTRPPQRRHQGLRQQQAGKGHDAIGHAHQHMVEPLVVAGIDPHDQPQHTGDDRHGKADAHGNLRAIDRTAEDIAAKVVGAHPMVRRRPLEPVDHVHLARIIAQEQRAKQRHQHQNGNDHKANHQGPVAQHLAHENAVLFSLERFYDLLQVGL
nr:hypothetical protein [Tropicibacter naphthalenivorans]